MTRHLSAEGPYIFVIDNEPLYVPLKTPDDIVIVTEAEDNESESPIAEKLVIDIGVLITPLNVSSETIPVNEVGVSLPQDSVPGGKESVETVVPVTLFPS